MWLTRKLAYKAVENSLFFPRIKLGEDEEEMRKRRGKDEEKMKRNLLFLLTFSFPFLFPLFSSFYRTLLTFKIYFIAFS